MTAISDGLEPTCTVPLADISEGSTMAMGQLKCLTLENESVTRRTHSSRLRSASVDQYFCWIGVGCRHCR